MRKAFSMVELIVVIAVIAVLSVIVLVGLSSSKNGSRDSRRIADITEVQGDLELYYAACGFYPGAANCAGGFTRNTNTWSALNTAITKSAGFNISNLPNDPSSGETYYYGVNASGTSYLLAAKMESSSDAIFKNYNPPADFASYNAQGLSSCNAPFYCTELLYSGVTSAPTTYSCVNNSCVQAGSGGVFSSLSACNASCGGSPPSSDTTAPTTPTGLKVVNISSSGLTLTWTASTDNVGVAGYDIYRNGTKVGTSAGTTFNEKGLSANSQYTYKVDAYDAAGNISSQSSGLGVTTEYPYTGNVIPASYFGIQANGGLVNSTPWPTIPFGTIRLWNSNTSWTNMNPASGAYIWTAFDKWLSLAKQHGVSDVNYTFGTTPAWAASNCNNGSNNICPPADLNSDGTGSNASWRNFVTAVVDRSKADAQAGSLAVKYWEVWNEYNASNFWRGNNTQLARMAQDLYCIVKGTGTITALGKTCANAGYAEIGIDPSAVILTPSSAGGVSKVYLSVQKWLATPGTDAVSDVVNVHGYVPYDTGDEGVYPQPEDINALISNVNGILSSDDRAKPLWVNEGSWGLITHNGFTNPDLQAAFTARTYLLAWSDGATNYTWFQYNNGGGTGSLWNETGMNGCTKAGGCLWEAGTAFGQVYGWMVGAVMPVPCSSSGTVWTCVFRRSGDYQAIAVWNTSSNSSYVPPVGLYTQYRDVLGNLTPYTSGSVTIGARPILFEN